MQENVGLLNRLDEVMADVHLLRADNHSLRQQLEAAEAVRCPLPLLAPSKVAVYTQLAGAETAPDSPRAQVQLHKADMEARLATLQATATKKEQSALAATQSAAQAASQVQDLALRYQGAVQELQQAHSAAAAADAAAQNAERHGLSLQQQLVNCEARWCGGRGGRKRWAQLASM